MMFASTLVLDRYDLPERNRDKPLLELRPPDFKPDIINLIKAAKIVIFLEYDDALPSNLIHTLVLRNSHGARGEIKPTV